jgi:tRNA U34 5-methylaminomethyl-2-thiouridine-forming methyltransferase MnmC
LKTTIITTADGSHSIYVEELNEHYHSVHGAIQESKHVFINAGFKHIASTLTDSTTQINILEIGLGTGLNAILTFSEAKKTDVIINYTAIEAYPIPIDLANELNYIELLNEQNNQSIFSAIHSCEWNKQNVLSDRFNFCKIKNTLQQFIFNDTYHLIYFDAFGPQVQPEMWTEDIFTKLYAATKQNGCLVTYCAKGEVKRTLKKVGFSVESLQGPPGKREMVRAVCILFSFYLVTLFI